MTNHIMLRMCGSVQNHKDAFFIACRPGTHESGLSDSVPTPSSRRAHCVTAPSGAGTGESPHLGLGVDVGAIVDQLPDHLVLTSEGGDVQGRVPFLKHMREGGGDVSHRACVRGC